MIPRAVFRWAGCALILLLSANHVPMALTDREESTSTKPLLVVQTPVGFTTDAYSCTMSKDTTRVWTASVGHGWIWDVKSGVAIRGFNGYCVAVSPDERWFVAGVGTELERVDSSNLVPGLRYRGHSDRINCVTISPDGDAIAAGSDDGQISVWDADTAHVRWTQAIHKGRASALAFSRDGRTLASGGEDGQVSVWNPETGARVGGLSLPHQQDGTPYGVATVAFALLHDQVLLTSHAGTALWDWVSGKHVRNVGGPDDDECSCLSRDGALALTAGREGVVRCWNLADGRLVREFHSPKGVMASVAFSADARLVLARHWSGAVHLWDATSGTLMQRLSGSSGEPLLSALSADGLRLAIGAETQSHLWDLQSGAVRQRFDETEDAGRSPVVVGTPRWVMGQLFGGENQIRSVDLAQDGRRLVTSSADGAIRIWDVGSGTLVHRLDPGSEMAIAKMRQATNEVVTAARDGQIRVWDLSKGIQTRLVASVGRAVGALAVSPDGRLLAAASFDSRVRVYDIDEAKRVWEASLPSEGGYQLGFSPDNKLLIGCGDEAFVWRSDSGEVVHHWTGLDDAMCAEFSRSGRFVLLGADTDGLAHLYDTSTWQVVGSVGAVGLVPEDLSLCADEHLVVGPFTDGTVRLWDASKNESICSLIALLDGSWAVVAADGRFDTGDLEHLRGVHWLMPDAPLTPIPVEVFMRDYYEPRLLPRLMAGETLRPVRDLATLNRVQPRVDLLGAQPMAGHPERVRVRVRVESVKDASRPAGQDLSGVEDLRLFRDGQLVAHRQGKIAVDAADAHRAQVVFEDISLPLRKGSEHVEFSAYAFNTDRVKGPTARLTYKLPAGLPHRRGTAYVVALGVDEFAGSQFKDLTCAAHDARAFTDMLAARLAEVGAYERVVTCTLTSSVARDSVGPSAAVAGTDRAHKVDLEAALALLAGRPVPVAQRERLKPLTRGGTLEISRPEDLVLVMTSTHGFTGSDGEFYLVPSDVTESTQAGWETSCISSAELGEWLRAVDAGDMAMVVDACQSAGAVEQGGFKPGPLGSRGLGQLAYDKRMRLLAACQKAGVALEDGGLGHGFLTYALLQDGLGQGFAADTSPKDGIVTLGEWMAYARDRVPVLDEQLKRGERRGWMLPDAPQAAGAQPSADKHALNTQTPSLFDFAKGKDPVVLARKK